MAREMRRLKNATKTANCFLLCSTTNPAGHTSDWTVTRAAKGRDGRLDTHAHTPRKTPPAHTSVRVVVCISGLI